VTNATPTSPHVASGTCEVALARLGGGVPAEMLDAVIGTLEPDRQARLARFRDVADIERGALADVLVRALVAGLAGLRPHAVRLLRETSGRPAIEGVPGIEVSIAHAGRWVVGAAAGSPIGVDVEVVRPVALGRALTPADIGSGSTGERDRTRRAVQAWTAKESYLKLLGAGLRIDPAEVRVTRSAGRTVVDGRAGDPRGHVHTASLDRDHQLAVCMRRRPVAAFWHTPFDEVLHSYLADETPFQMRSPR
jgi:4'-phosphopantetheinyl transferase